LHTGFTYMAENSARSELTASTPVSYSSYPGTTEQRFRDIVEFWHQLKNGAQLPRRADIRPEALAPWLGSIVLVEVDPTVRRYRLRLIGTRIAEVVGRDSTGRWFDELYDGQDLEALNAIYSACVERREPQFVRSNIRVSGKEFICFDAVHLPFADADDDVCMIVVFIVFG
jgi:hypothetical protein